MTAVREVSVKDLSECVFNKDLRKTIQSWLGRGGVILQEVYQNVAGTLQDAINVCYVFVCLCVLIVRNVARIVCPGAGCLAGPIFTTI